MNKLIMVAGSIAFAGLVAGCSSAAQRQADCEAKGISRDTCYLAEQQRQSAIVSASEKQAMENAQRAVDNK